MAFHSPAAAGAGGPAAPQSQPDYFDIDKALDFSAFSGLKLFVVCLISLAIILEAVAANVLGLAIPKMMDDWGLPREAFKWAVTFSFIGMAVGAFFSGQIADRIGRRAALLLTLPICGIATICIAATSSVSALVALRFFVGLGFGGALPVAASMIAEFAPVRYRTMCVSVAMVSVAFGTSIAGFLFNIAVYLSSWHSAFYICGILPLLMLAIAYFTLPESPRFMAQHKAKWPALRLLLARLGSPAAEYQIFTDSAGPAQPAAAETPAKHESNIAALFKNGLAPDTLAIWLCSFSGIFGEYLIFSWLPTILHMGGLSEYAARNAMAYWFSLGGVIGGLICAWSCARFGTRKVMISFAAGAALSIFILLFVDIKRYVLLMSLLIGLNGFFNYGLQVPLYAVYANLYPTRIRATGASLASAIGKLGTILAGFAGAFLTLHSYFIVINIMMVLMLLGLIAFKRHIPPVITVRKPEPIQ